jgi:hypothetical protein
MKSVGGCFAFAALLACAAPVAAESVRIAHTTPYADEAEVSQKIRTECVKLPGQLPAYTAEFGREFGVEVDLVDAPAPSRGRVLELEIYEAVSMGNAFIGHQKFAKVRGTLFEDGQRVAAFRGMRNSMGGAFGGYKGSCSVLGRTMKALGKDIAQWLSNPRDGAELGDF